MYNFVMRRNERKAEAIGILMLLLIFLLIVFWREVLIVAIIFLIAKIIYKIIKVVSITNEDEPSVRYVGDIVKLEDETEEYYKNLTKKLSENKTRYVGDIVKLDEELSEDYKKYLKDSNVQKGIEAELNIVRILKRIFSEKDIIHDSYFWYTKEDTTQVDVIAIDTTGIYVIESKAYSSIIKGKEKDKNWVQLFSKKKRQLFYNPINQNEWHIKAIKDCLEECNIPDIAFKSYIVFDDNCKLNLELSDKCNVIQQKNLFYNILQKKMVAKEILTEKQVKDIAKILRAHANVDDSVKMEHVLRRINNKKHVKKGDR